MARKGFAKRDRRIRIERPLPDGSPDGAGSGTWETVCEIWAEIEDVLPSHGERLADGLTIATRPSRVRFLFRRGITPDMRILVLRKVAGVYEVERETQIVAGPAEIRNRRELEFMVEEYSSAGNTA